MENNVMKKLVITMGLTLVASTAVANVDPVVSEYQKIDALQKVAPSLADALITLNGRTATSCDAIASFDDAIKFDEVLALVAYVTNKRGLDGSEEFVRLLDKATIAVCQSLISSMLEKPQAMTEFEKQLKVVTSKYALDLMSGMADSVTASKQLNDDYAELRNKYLGQNENAEKWNELKTHYKQSLACGLASGEVDQQCLDKFNNKDDGLKKGYEIIADYLKEQACTLPSGEVDQDCMSK
ncbi:hypothetical protein OKZ62_001850 [Vibrio navarrensis]|nr:hypothetical protein [Vibrio navarrensis]